VLNKDAAVLLLTPLMVGIVPSVTLAEQNL
jgi:hypothetical protein